MNEKKVNDLKVKYTKEDRRTYQYHQNQKNAKSCVLITESRRWFYILKTRPYLYRLHLFLWKVKKMHHKTNELMNVRLDKIIAIRNQNFEAAASFRDTELQMKHVWEKKYQITEIDFTYRTARNGRVNLGLFHITKNS